MSTLTQTHTPQYTCRDKLQRFLQLPGQDFTNALLPHFYTEGMGTSLRIRLTTGHKKVQ